MPRCTKPNGSGVAERAGRILYAEAEASTRGLHLLNTIAGRIIRPNGLVMYYTSYQLYGPWGDSALTCDTLSTETLRTLGVKDGYVVDFVDLGGSFV